MADNQAISSAIDTAFTEAASEPSVSTEQAAAPTATTDSPETAKQPPDTATAQPPAEEGADENTLLSPAEIEEYKKVPGFAEAIKVLQPRFTQKTQALAEQRKQIEEFYESLQTDPEGTLRAVAEQYGVKIPAAPAAATPEQAATKQAVDEIAAEAERLFGPEVAKPLMGLVEKLAQRTVERATEPLKTQAQQAQSEAAARDTKALMDNFAKQHPGWEKHDAKMSEIMSQLRPAPGMEPEQYLEQCYRLATWDISEAEKTKAVQEKMVAAAKKAESPGSGVPSQRVAKAAPKFENLNSAIEQSFKDATEGVLYE